jgi:hypothetical protein
MPKPALRNRLLVLAALLGMSAPAAAAPAPLDSDADVAAFAERVRAYAKASLVRWTVVAPTRAEADARIAAILGELSPSEQGLAKRLIPLASADAHGISAYVSPQIGATGGGACSWQVWVTDPALPAPDGQTAMAPLAPRDHFPVGPKATFRVGHFGLVQSKLYAFDETRPGAIRDLATVSAIDIPVPTEGDADYVVLAAARNAAPVLESVKTALAGSQGERKDLGSEFALRERLLGAGRGIGANIEVVPSSMIVRKLETAAQPKSDGDDGLMETCLYTLTPAR